MKKENRKPNMNSLLKIISILYGIMFAIVILLLLFFSGMPYHLKRKFLIDNIFVVIPFFLILFLFYKFHREKEIEKSHFKKILIILSILTGILQLVLIINTYFYTDWDVKVIRELVDTYIKNGNLKDEFYLTIYPNNVLITAILAFIRKLPFIGKYYITTLIFNAFLVNISGVFATLTLKNLKGSRAAIMGYIVMLPLVLLSPWINIPYSDTFALPCVTILMYFYSKDKKLKDYILMGFVAIIGYKLKPTVIILLIAIVIVEGISNLNKISMKNIKSYSKIVCIFLIGAICGFGMVKLSKVYLKFEPVNYIRGISFIHYLAMGQNDETVGMYSQTDVDDTINYGIRYDLSKFKKRVISRNLSETINFYSKKTLVNFNDGSFSWGVDGVFFYKKVKPTSEFANFLREIYYRDGKYYNLFIQVQNYIWILVLLFCPFIIKKDNSKKEYVIMLAIIGLVMFLTLFEPRTRYMYCYSEIFVMAAILGIYNLKDITKNVINSKKIRSQ